MLSLRLIRLSRLPMLMVPRASMADDSSSQVLMPLLDNKLVPEVPLKSLPLDNIKKATKKGSFSVDIFRGDYDEDFLIFPEVLETAKQSQFLMEQKRMVKQLVPQIWDDPVQLQKFNFHNIYQMTVTEMMTIFEAIGSCVRCSSDLSDSRDIPSHHLVCRSVISLIIRNCLTYWPMSKSTNQHIRDLLPKNSLLTESDPPSKLLPPIGFCWTEQAPRLGSLPPQEWQTFAQFGDANVDHLTLSGRKTMVLREPDTENYLLYYRDRSLSEKYLKEIEMEKDPNPASDPFVGCVIVNKSELKFEPPYVDSAGFLYNDVTIDEVVPEDRLVFPAKRKDTTGVNVKALGQVASCSVVMGILKEALRATYERLLREKKPLLDCDIIEMKMTSVTSKIFAIESMIYYIAGMYDGLNDGFDAHLEATILKVVTNDYAFEILRDLQQINGTDAFIISKMQDLVNIFDSFLDGNVYNRLYLSTMGVLLFCRANNHRMNKLRLSPYYPGHLIRSLIRERADKRDFLQLNADVYGQLHPSLKEAATNLEYVIKRVEFASETLLMKYGKDVTSAQAALYRLSQISIDTFMLTAMCARASRGYVNGVRNSDIDVSLVTYFSYDIVRKVKLYMEELQIIPLRTIENRSKDINELNMKLGGYYADSPLNPNL